MCWPGGVRRGGGVSLVCGSCTEHEKASVDTAGRSLGLVGPRLREGACRGSNRRHGVLTRRSLADRPVVAGKSLLAGVGAEPRGRLIRTCCFDQPAGGREEEREHGEAARREAVRHPQTGSVGGVQAGGGQQGCCGCGRADAERVRGRSEEQPLQDLESDELGVVLSAPGQGGRDPQAARRWGPFAR